jgi:hypothetical protein
MMLEKLRYEAIKSFFKYCEAMKKAFNLHGGRQPLSERSERSGW